MIRILTFSTLYPNDQQPVHGIFVENRLRHLVASGEVEARVIAPVPWFPFTSPMFGQYAAFARSCREEERHGIKVLHPRFPVIPKVGMNLAPHLLYHFMRPVIRRLIQDGYDFDLLDAHYFYPDGVAAAMLAREFGKPLVVTARGTDLNLIPQHSYPRGLIRRTAEQSNGIVTVCAALKEPLLDMGIEADKVHVLRNGVDLTGFQPRERESARNMHGLSGKVALSVGALIERKGHHVSIEALKSLPGLTLMIAGAGPEEAALKKFASELGVSDRVRFLGRVPHEELSTLYSAADISILASSREGWANVLLESMACGTPVVATDIWGTGEVVASPEAGVLVPERTAPSLAKGVRQLLDHLPVRSATRAYAENFSWDDTTNGQLDLFRKILA